MVMEDKVHIDSAIKTSVLHQYRNLLVKSALLLLLGFFILPSYAQAPAGFPTDTTSLSAQNMLVNIAQQMPMLMRLLTAIAYVLGMIFILQGIIYLKHFGESRTMMSQEHNLKKPLIFLAVGTLLLYLPSAFWVATSTFWTDASPYSYLQTKTTDQWSSIIKVAMQIIQFVGVLSFIRGLVILTHLGGHGGQPGTLGRGLTHIVGGIFCINIYQFVQVIMNTIGFQ